MGASQAAGMETRGAPHPASGWNPLIMTRCVARRSVATQGRDNVPEVRFQRMSQAGVSSVRSGTLGAVPKARGPLRPVHVALVLVLVAAVAALLWPGRRLREDPGDVLRALRASRGPALPAPERVGATRATAPARYGKDTLADVIDGAAEAYLANGFTAAAMAVYAFGAEGAVIEIAAEAHRFEREEGARAQAAAERPRRPEPVPGVAGAVSDGAVLLAVAGRDLLKLTVVTPGGGGADALAAVAAAWRKEQGP